MCKERKPHACPVCFGKGVVPNGFYNTTTGNYSITSTASEKCQSCWGAGIVWG